MFKKITFTLVGLALLVGLPALIKMQQFSAMGAMPMAFPPETVTAAPARAERWPEYVSAVGSLVTVQGVTVGAELGGKVVEIAFESGDTVKAGDLLVRLDTAAEEAQLRSAEAAVKLARINLERNRDLRDKRTVSQADLDAAEANYKQASAQADNIRAAIAKKTLRAPFAGHLGLRLVNLGQFLHEGEAIVTLQTLDPIYADFSVPQQQFSMVTAGAPVQVTTDAAPGRQFKGRVSAVNPEIDSVTRSVRVRATLANDGELLRPGMFAKVAVVLPGEETVLAIPATSVLYAPYGDTVFVIEESKDEQSGESSKTLRQQVVRLGRTRGDFVAVLDGLKEGESVVTSGVFKLRPKMAVVVDNTLAPDAQLAPSPGNQ